MCLVPNTADTGCCVAQLTVISADGNKVDSLIPTTLLDITCGENWGKYAFAY